MKLIEWKMWNENLPQNLVDKIDLIKLIKLNWFGKKKGKKIETINLTKWNW